MDVVVISAVDKQKSAVQVASAGNQGRLVVACRVVLRELQKRLNPLGVIKSPVSHRRPGDAGFEFLGPGHQVQSDGATSTPTPNADAASVNPWLRFEPANAGNQVFCFSFTRIHSEGVLERLTDGGGGTVINRYRDVTFAREQIVEEGFVLPLVDDGRRRRAPIHMQDDGITALGIEAFGFENLRRHGKAVRGRNSHELGIFQAGGQQPGLRGCDRGFQFSAGSVEAQHGKRMNIRVSIEIKAGVGRHADGVGSRLGRNALQSAAITVDAIELALYGSVLERSEIDPVVRFIDPDDSLAYPEDSAS